MARAKQSTSPKIGILRQRQPKVWAVPEVLKSALRVHALWPNLKACHWQDVTRKELGLKKKIGVADRRYNVIKKFIANERDRQQKQASVFARQPVDDMPDCEMAQPEYEEPVLDESQL